MTNKGIRFGQYELLRRIGRGGMAEVFLAIERGFEGLERQVAIKRILPNMAEADDFVTMFMDEARVAAMLTHPNIAHIYSFGEVDGVYYLAMEYINGLNCSRLRKLSKPAGIPIEIVLRIVADLCAALHHAHEMKNSKGEIVGLVHRDVNPQNIMVSKSGVGKLLDFGVARAATQSHATRVGQVKGKISYIAPEVFLGQPITRRADVFSTGAVLFELIAGKKAFVRDIEAATIAAVLNDTPPKLSLSKKIPIEVDNIIDKALKKDPGERYETALDMQQDIENLIVDQGYLSTPFVVGKFVNKMLDVQAEARKKKKKKKKKSDPPKKAAANPLSVDVEFDSLENDEPSTSLTSPEAPQSKPGMSSSGLSQITSSPSALSSPSTGSRISSPPSGLSKPSSVPSGIISRTPPPSPLPSLHRPSSSAEPSLSSPTSSSSPSIPAPPSSSAPSLPSLPPIPPPPPSPLPAAKKQGGLPAIPADAVESPKKKEPPRTIDEEIQEAASLDEDSVEELSLEELDEMSAERITKPTFMARASAISRTTYEKYLKTKWWLVLDAIDFLKEKRLLIPGAIGLALVCVLILVLSLVLGGDDTDEVEVSTNITDPTNAVPNPPNHDPDTKAIENPHGKALTPSVPDASVTQAKTPNNAKTPEKTPDTPITQANNQKADGPETQPNKRPRNPTKREPRQPPGKLFLYTSPWSKAIIGGRRLGTTPLHGVSVPAGNHTLTLIDAQGKRHRRRVRIAPGKATKVRFDLR